MRRIKFLQLGVGCWALGVCFIFSSCAHVIAPKTNVSHQASYDPKDTALTGPTSGIVSIAPGGKGRIVSAHYRDRYNALIDLYGDQFNPPLKHDDGIEGWTWASSEIVEWRIDMAHHIQFGQMQQWKRDGRKPTGGFKRLFQKLYPANSPEREREHEFTEMQIKHLRP